MAHGGKRKYAGRPCGKGPYGENTKLIRVPCSLVDDTRHFIGTKGFRMPVFTSRVPAGSPSLADSHVDQHAIPFNRLFPDPENMAWAFASGDSMIDIGIYDGTPLIIHFKRKPKNHDVVIGMINGEQTVKVLQIKDGKTILEPKNDRHQEIVITSEMDFKVVGIVTNWLGKPFLP